MQSSNPTRGQTERALGQRLQALYRDRTGQRPEKVTCQFFDEKLAIVLEQILTPAEQFLIQSNHQDLAKQFRSTLESTLRPEIIALIEELAEAPVLNVLSDTDLKTGCSAIVAILKDIPSVRDPESIPKVKREKLA